MALRGKEETFVRRFAAGGNDGVPFNPRGYGDHSRRFAARGNEIVDHENFRESCDGYHPRRFAARGNEDHDLLYDSSPIFDEYEDEEWYSWATGGIQVVVGVAGVANGCVGLVGDESMDGYQVRSNARLADYPQNCEDLNFSKNIEKENIIIADYVGETFNNYYRSSYRLTDKTILLEVQIENYPPNIKVEIGDIFAKWISMATVHVAFTRGEQVTTTYGGDVGSKASSNNSIAKRKQFDPGGKSAESGNMTCEIKMFRWVLIIIMRKNRVDVPFDPGGFGPKAKLEDEFSRRGGV